MEWSAGGGVFSHKSCLMRAEYSKNREQTNLWRRHVLECETCGADERVRHESARLTTRVVPITS